jgi:DNA-binding PadR family transcriptional regulator
LTDRALSLTDDEGTLLALVLRVQPVTAYQIARIYEESPVSNFNTSKGKLYPLIRRLRTLGLLEGRPVEGDARGTERLEGTEQGKAAVRHWLKRIRPAHLLLEDPLRTKIQSFDLLSREEQLEWIVGVKARLLEKLEELEAYGEQVTVPYHAFVHDNAVTALRARMDWLDRILYQMVKESGSSRSTAAD